MADLKKNNIYFSSDDSLCSDNSFNSSNEEEIFNEKNDYRTSVYHLKEQMSQFFLQNPGLKDEIQFEKPIFIDDKQQPSSGLNNNNQQNQQARSRSMPAHLKSGDIDQTTNKMDYIKNMQNKPQPQISKMWGVLSKDILKGSSKQGKAPPSLEQLNTRLNIFRSKTEKVDFLELLSRETENKSRKEESKNKAQQQQNKLSTAVKVLNPLNGGLEEEEGGEGEQKGRADSSSIEFYSFKKKMQLAGQRKKEKQLKKKSAQDHFAIQNNNNLDESHSHAKGGTQFMQDQKKKQLNIHERLFKKDAIANSADKTKEGTNNNAQGANKNMEFQSQIGQLLYKVLQQTEDDSDAFKASATEFIKKYNKNSKETLAKLKTVPPQVIKFTANETKKYNFLLPDYNLGMYIKGKQDLFKNLDDVKPNPNTPEYEFLKTINKIMDGKIVNFWNNCQNNQ